MQKYQSALLGGLFIGVLSSLPVVNIANCCCLWVLAGGVLTVYLQQQKLPEAIETGEAVVGGLIAGAIGGLIAAVVDIVKIQMVGQVIDIGAQMREALDKNPGITPEMKDRILSFVDGKGMAFLMGMRLMAVPVFAVFGMLGGLLGMAFFKKKTPKTTA